MTVVRVYLHTHVERPDGRKECFQTTQVPFVFTPKGKMRIKTWLGWRTVRDKEKHPDRRILIRDDYLRSKLTIEERP